MKRWLVTILFAGCATAPLPPIVDAPPPPPEPRSPRLDREGEDLPSEAVLERAFVVGGVDLQAPLRLEAGRCAWISAALARGIDDADLDAFDRDGAVLAYDREPTRFPALLICAGETLELVLRLHAASGAGEASLVVAPIDPDAAPALPASARCDRRGAEPDVEARLARLLEPRGFVADARRPPIDLGDAPAVGALSVAPGECLTVLARADREAALALSLRAPDGRVLARDEGSGRDLVAQACVETDAPSTWALVLESAQPMRVITVVGRALARRIGGETGLGGIP